MHRPVPLPVCDILSGDRGYLADHGGSPSPKASGLLEESRIGGSGGRYLPISSSFFRNPAPAKVSPQPANSACHVLLVCFRRGLYSIYTENRGIVIELEFTSHAETVMLARSIAGQWVEAVLSSPERIEPHRDDPELKHALGRIPERAGRVLRVVYNDSVVPVRVVTVYFDRTQRNKL